MPSRRTPRGKLAALVVCLTALGTPAALAKGRITVAISDPTPKVGRPFTVYVDTGFIVPTNDWLRLLVAAPGTDWHHGVEIRLRRVAPRHWRAVVRLPRPGRWRIVLPNGTHEGFMLPPPADWMP